MRKNLRGVKRVLRRSQPAERRESERDLAFEERGDLVDHGIFQQLGKVEERTDDAEADADVRKAFAQAFVHQIAACSKAVAVSAPLPRGIASL
jgi:hypothetical protein